MRFPLLPLVCAHTAAGEDPIASKWTTGQTPDAEASWGRSASLDPLGPAADVETFLAGQSRPALWIEAFALASIIGVIDFAVTNEVNLALFQLLPVMFATWYISRRAGILFAFVTLGAWVTTDIISGVQFSSSFVPYWNGAVRLAFFLIVITLTWVMRDAKAQALELSRTDLLTGCANSRNFAGRAALEIARMRRSGKPLTLAYLDLDKFKHINDTRGHGEGDRLLRATAAAIAGRIRSTDFVARLGGDEFAILLPETDAQAAPRVLAAVDAAVARVAGAQWGVGCTIGAVTFESGPPSVDYMVRTADALMYEGKRAGRGRILHEVWSAADEVAGAQAAADQRELSGTAS